MYSYVVRRLAFGLVTVFAGARLGEVLKLRGQWIDYRPFHGGNTGSNPVGDANKINS
jgi:hypothetical protein